MRIYSKGHIPDSNHVSKVRYNREYLLSKETARDLNTYLGFSPFATFNDLYDPVYEKQGNNWVEKDKNGPGLLGVRSIFNKSGAVIIGGNETNLFSASQWRISNNVPLMDSPDNRKAIRDHSKCSVKDLVEASREGLLGKSTYDYSDFMYCKHLGKVPNNYLITLRRFPLPVDDYISTLGVGLRTDPDIASRNSQSIGCLVTWMGTPGNEMANLLSYNYKMPFKFQDAQWEENNVDADSSGGLLNGIAAAFDSKYREQYMQGAAGSTFNNYFGKMFGAGNQHYNASTFNNFQDRNKVYGPVDAIKGTYIRSSTGLEFNQQFTITFDYELRSYNGINGRQAMLDLLSNILNVTYSTGTFWGGGYRGGGAHQNNIFANLSMFKAKGGMNNYVDAFSEDYSKVKDQVISSFAGKNPIEVIKNAINQIGGMLIAGQLNKLGRPHKIMMHSLLSPAPIGFWHLTIGNPHHPIMSVGNLVLTDTKIEHYGSLGLDDFPTGLKVTCTLERGKPRDIRDIEKMYMHGNDRIFSSMGPKIFDMYKHAKTYQGSTKISNANSDFEVPTNVEDLKTVPGDLGNVIKKYFGHNDAYSIYVAAAEQEYGAHKKPSAKKGPSSGDSRAAGTGGFSGNN